MDSLPSMNIASMQEIQKNYRRLFDSVMKEKQPLVVMRHQTPQVVILDMETYKSLNEIRHQYEIMDTKKAIASYKKAKKEGKLVKLNSIADLM